jgi:hypothetical protein
MDWDSKGKNERHHGDEAQWTQNGKIGNSHNSPLLLPTHVKHGTQSDEASSSVKWRGSSSACVHIRSSLQEGNKEVIDVHVSTSDLWLVFLNDNPWRVLFESGRSVLPNKELALLHQHSSWGELNFQKALQTLNEWAPWSRREHQAAAT